MTRAELESQAEWMAGADLEDGRFDDEELEECERCHGDGRDPWNDYLLPCPLCQGEQTP